MDHARIYDALMTKAKGRGLNKAEHTGYFEFHHIVPRCRGGSDAKNNLVMLTGREHYIAHMLLWKMHPSDYLLVYAAFMMANVDSRNGGKINSRLYAAIREEFARVQSKLLAGMKTKSLVGVRNHRLLVVSHAGYKRNSHGGKMAMWNCVCDCGVKRVLFTKEVSPDCEGSYKSCGCLVADTARLGVGEKNPFFGKRHSDSAKAKMREKRLGKMPANAGIPKSDACKAKISATKRARGQLPWEHPSIVSNNDNMTIWRSAGALYAFWVALRKPAFVTFSIQYNRLYGTNLIASKFKTLVTKFSEGWIPFEDNAWVNTMG